jgi:hypothetical protein
MWAIPFQTVGVEALQGYISEWASPDFHQLGQQPFMLLLLATFGAAGLSARRLDGSEMATVVAFAALALLARRNFGPFALAAAPVLARSMATLPLVSLGELGKRVRWFLERLRLGRGELSPAWRTGINLAILLLLGSAALLKLWIVSSPGLVTSAQKELFPLEAVSWIKSNRPAQTLFNEYAWGGYLTWALREYPVFVDGRTDLYGDEVLETYLQTQAGVPGWKGTLERYGINLVLVPVESGLAEALYGAPDWSAAYRDELAIIYIRNGKISTRPSESENE